MATIKDVAKVAGVSFKTVSRVINKVDSVRPELRQRVLAAIEELGYQPNQSARELRGRPRSIAFMYDNPNSHYVIELQKGILAECHSRGYELIIHPCDSAAPDIIDELLRVLRRVKVGGVVLMPPLSETKDVVTALLDAGIPVVRVVSGSGVPDNLSPCVYVDDRHAAYDITKLLIKNGHERIAFLCGDPEHGSTGERLKGYLDAMKDSGLQPDPTLIMDGQYSFESGVERTKDLLLLEQKPTAVFACNDEIAAGTLFTARMCGVNVPEDLSIAGFEDSPFSRQTWPNVTTARQSNEALARSATALLIDEISRRQEGREPENGAPASICIRPELIVRSSTGPAPKSF